MKTKLIICTLAAALVVGGFTTTQLRAADTSSELPARGRILERIADKLDLSSDQRAKIKAILSGEKDNLTPLLSAVHDSRKDLRTAIRATGASEASVRAASAKVAAAEADLAVERMKLYGKIGPVLTDAQRQQVAEMQQNADEFVDNVINRIGSGLGD